MGVRFGVFFCLFQAMAAEGSPRGNVFGPAPSSTGTRKRFEGNNFQGAANHHGANIIKPQRYRMEGNAPMTGYVRWGGAMMWKGNRKMSVKQQRTMKNRWRGPYKPKQNDNNGDSLFWGDGVPATRAWQEPPTSPPPVADIVQADFSAATAQDPLVLFAVVPAHSIVEVEVFMPFASQGTELYLVEGQNVEPGSTCSIEDGTMIPTSDTSSSMVVFLNDGVDTILVLCDQNVVIAQSYYLFQSPNDVPDGADRQWYEDVFLKGFFQAIDFSNASLENPLVGSYNFPGFDPEDSSSAGSVVLYGSLSKIDAAIARRYPSQQLSVDSFYLVPLVGGDLGVGDTCPLEGSEKLTPHEIYPLTILYLPQPEPKTVYACESSVVVGIIDFDFT